MVQIVAGISIAYTITYFLLPLIIRFAHDNKLYDLPDERKIHNHKVSPLGGVAIFVGLIMSLLLISDFNIYNAESQYFIAAFFGIFIIGVIDDLFFLMAWKKFVGQLLVAAMLIFKANLLITDLHGFLGIHALTYSESIYVSFFSVILIINSFNLIDGVDGLAGSIGLISCLFFGVVFLMNNIIPYALLSFSLCGALLAFLKYNYPPAKIFMGDSGSTLIGLMTAILAIKFIGNDAIREDFSNLSTPAIAFGFLLIPLMDVLRVFALRIYKKQSPLTPDRNHLHHLLQNKGLSHIEITATLASAQFLFACLSLLIQGLDLNVILAIQFIVYFGSIYVLKTFIPMRKKLHIVRTEEILESGLPGSKVYPIYSAKEKISAREDS
jgi:UDP-GlcNAc:undecaprenyl-phosphate GlcNAc-1-phosphate transferase